MDFMGMLGKMNKAQEGYAEVQEILAKEIIQEQEEAVKVEIFANKQIKSIELNEDFYSRFTKEEGAEMLMECLNNAFLKADAMNKELMKSKISEVMPNIGGMDLSSMLGGMFK